MPISRQDVIGRVVNLIWEGTVSYQFDKSVYYDWYLSLSGGHTINLDSA